MNSTNNHQQAAERLAMEVAKCLWNDSDSYADMAHRLYAKLNLPQLLADQARCKELEAEVARLRELVPPPRGPAHPTRCLCGFEGKTIKDIRAHRQQCEIWQSQFGWNSGTNPQEQP